MTCLRRLLRLSVLAPTLLVATSATPPHAPATPSDPVAYYPDVRLRKLHLIRPDLIPYPILYEIIC